MKRLKRGTHLQIKSARNQTHEILQKKIHAIVFLMPTYQCSHLEPGPLLNDGLFQNSVNTVTERGLAL